MSFATWSKEFYPKPADCTDKADAIQHSLTKWQGLLPAAMQKHGVQACSSWSRNVQAAKSGPGLYINSKSCALCFHYFDDTRLSVDSWRYYYEEKGALDEFDPSEVEHSCSKCPLAIARGGYSCDSLGECDDSQSPYEAFQEHAEPKPMIRWLKKALKESK